MALVASSKGKDFNTWLAARDFVLTCRQTLLESAACMSSEQAEELFAEVERELAGREALHADELAHLRLMIAEAATAGGPDLLHPLVDRFYTACYDFFGRNRSAIAFFHLSAEFLRAASTTIVGYARQQTGCADLPVALIALNSGGRREFSPLHRLQLLLVHGGDAPEPAVMERFGRVLEEAFQAAGLSLDGQVTPGRLEWRGSMRVWKQRVAELLERNRSRYLNDLTRLADQDALFSDQGLADEFYSSCVQALEGSRSAHAFLVSQMMGLSTGIGMMGGIRLARRGAQRGMFGLLEHALLPLSSAIGSLALLKGVREVETTQRVRKLLARSEIDVEMAERLLEAWHFFNELRLQRETACLADRAYEAAGYFDVQASPAEVQERFKDFLETVATLQRHVGIAFSGLMEQV
ncbi:putative nucleotidyltransferase substrate binding domain-containing protein [Geobacter sp. SVR]|uniref:putative nucleotidyltransferase substrate binding domain-containing protein n=1 Tax=Geobacter sp. SVR TaxID=2495594 RepID=UPI00143EF6A3|nr:putative nucleotidyltransferase substrate binding domain-containing protein [Geobacter sp. SVR]BCS55264.1 nucleotidyltransferase [Geobacter sp. SVR]GCF86063.1 hypothetical protein GSbR_26630 [Geobacter sp. SVR]